MHGPTFVSSWWGSFLPWLPSWVPRQRGCRLVSSSVLAQKCGVVCLSGVGSLRDLHGSRDGGGQHRGVFVAGSSPTWFVSLDLSLHVGWVAPSVINPLQILSGLLLLRFHHISMVAWSTSIFLHYMRVWLRWFSPAGFVALLQFERVEWSSNGIVPFSICHFW